MYKTTLAVAMFLGATDAHRPNHAPESVSLFADGMEGHEDLNTSFTIGRGADKVVIKDLAQKQSAAEIKNGCEKGETMVDGNCTFEFTNVQLEKSVPHDYGDEAAISAQHKYTMDQANLWESQRVAAVNAQQSSDVWRGQGAKIAWESAVQLEKPTQTKDIANSEVRPDVWVEVHKMINPTSNWRTQEAPKSTYEPYSPAGTGPKEKEWANPTAKEVADKIKKDKAVPEETKEEADAKKEAKPVKKPNPDYEGDDLAEPKESEEPKEELALQTVLYDSVNHLWRY
jgi:hypothetical protein